MKRDLIDAGERLDRKRQRPKKDDEFRNLDSSSILETPEPSMQQQAARAYVASAISEKCLPEVRNGTIRWYNGRRGMGQLIPDDGKADIFIPEKGTHNGNQVPPQPGGLFHGTRVSYTPVALDPKESRSKIVSLNTLPLAGQVGLSAGVECIAGVKEINDDRVCAADLHELGFLAGVFDGHRGFMCSDFVSQKMPAAVLDAYRARVKKIKNVAFLSGEKEVDLISRAIEDAFTNTDKAWLHHSSKHHQVGGSTGVVALVSHGFETLSGQAASCTLGTVASAPGGLAKLFVAWCGDSRAVLCRGCRGVRLSEDHKPNTRAEQSRIKAAGGHVMRDPGGTWRVGKEEEAMLKELQKVKKRKSSDPDRECWLLSTSRSFGDVELKVPDPLVIVDPELRVIDLLAEDWAIVLACDGVFDVLSDQEVADIVCKEHSDPVKAAKAVVQRALSSGSHDNLTAFVMRLGWSSAPGAVTGLARASSAARASDPDLGMFG